MLQEHTKYLPVNWFDGMSINKMHFIAMENHTNERLIDNAGQRIHKNNYGILPGKIDTKSIRIDIDSHHILRVIIRNLRAVTISGARIELTEDTIPQLELTCKINDYLLENKKDNNYKLSLILTVDPFGRNPCGNADPEEMPPRKPNVLPDYTINLIPTHEIENSEIGLHHLTIGQLTIESNEFKVNRTYIPPCSSIDSYPTLTDVFYQTEQQLIDLEVYTIKIIQKVRGKNQQNSLAITLCDIAEKILQYVSSQLPIFRLNLVFQEPICLFEKIITLSRITHNTIDTWRGNGKEELITYFSEWCKLNQGLFEEILTDLAIFTYIHNDIESCIKKTEKFLNILVPLFKTLSELDYIGKTVDSQLFVTEDNSMFEVKNDEPEVKRNWFKKL